MNTLFTVAFSYLNTPYIFGGQSFAGIDCSGLIQEILKSVGVCPAGDRSAAGLRAWFLTANAGRLLDLVGQPDLRGWLLWFGRDGNISHVALGIDSWRMIEAGGGDETTRTAELAAARNACVRIRPISSRRDFACAMLPIYPAQISPFSPFSA